MSSGRVSRDRRRQLEWRHRELVLAAQPQRTAAGHQERGLRAASAAGSRSSGTAGMRCSKVSITTNARLPARRLVSSSTSSGPVSTTPITLASSGATRAASLSSPSATKKTPPPNSARTWAAASSASRVLPMPPGPVSVSRRTCGPEAWRGCSPARVLDRAAGSEVPADRRAGACPPRRAGRAASNRARSSLAQPQRRGEPASGVAVDDRAEAALHVADRAGADARPVRELLLGHPGRRPELLESDAQRLIGHRVHLPHRLHVTHIGELAVSEFPGAADAPTHRIDAAAAHARRRPVR